jgi:hypothetical protein
MSTNFQSWTYMTYGTSRDIFGDIFGDHPVVHKRRMLSVIARAVVHYMYLSLDRT